LKGNLIVRVRKEAAGFSSLQDLLCVLGFLELEKKELLSAVTLAKPGLF
jgi:hypothetical protein